MQFSKLALVAAVAAPAFAQDVDGLLSALPGDLASYVDSLEANTAVGEALVGLFTASQVQGVVGQILTAGPDTNPTALAQSLEVAASEAIAAAPSDQRAIATSVIGVITSLAATDGVLNSLGAAVTGTDDSGSSTAAGSASMQTTTHASSGSAAGSSGAKTAAASAPSSAGAASPTGMALGAFVGAVAGVAMVL